MGMTETLDRPVSNFLRILLPGERAWGEIIEGIDADTKKVRIDNNVGTENQHAYRYNDEVVVVRDDGEGWLVIGRAT